jgi:hypothetical protein
VIGMQALKARVHNGRLVLDEPTDLSEGTVVRVVIEPQEGATNDVTTPELLAQAWQQWVEHGPQGPIEDESDGWRDDL